MSTVLVKASGHQKSDYYNVSAVLVKASGQSAAIFGQNFVIFCPLLDHVKDLYLLVIPGIKIYILY